MRKITLLFPGQGSQYVGMGKKLEGETAFNLFNKANEALGFNLTKIIFEGPESELQATYHAQPSILTYSMALFEKLKSILDRYYIQIERVLGHSLGEYSALCAAGTLDFSDAVRIVNQRGLFMQQAVPPGVGKMIAILKAQEDLVVKACTEVSVENSKVRPANFNDPSQIVISGEAQACDRAIAWLEKNSPTPIRAMALKVSAPFHSEYMQPAAAKLAPILNTTQFKPNNIPYVANVDACEYGYQTSASTIRKNLVEQMTGSVRWTQSIRHITPDTLCFEVGPGKVLTGLVGKINPQIKVIPLDRDEAFRDIEELFS